VTVLVDAEPMKVRAQGRKNPTAQATNTTAPNITTTPVSPPGPVVVEVEATPVGGCSSIVSPNIWQNITPPSLAGAFAFAFAIDPNNSGTVYLGTIAHGIWKTTNCGATWTGPINTGPGNPNNPGTPVPGSTLSGSNGNGMNWAMTIDPTNSYLYSTVGYAAGGLYKSTDGGVNWNQLLPESIRSITSNGFVNHISIDPTNNLHLVADFHVHACTGTAPPGAAVIQGTDFQNPVIVSYTQSTPTGGRTRYAGWGCLAETHDGGATWTLTAAPAPWGGMDGPGITIINDKTWFFGQLGGKLWRTTSGGVPQNGQPAWTQVNIYVSSCLSSATNCACTGNVCSEPMTGSTGFVYMARDGSFYSGGNRALVHSTDGVNWTQISNQYSPSIADDNGLPAIVDTGTTLYAPNNATNQYFTASVSQIQNYIGTAPTSLMTQLPTNSAMTSGGGIQLDYDPINHIVYSSNGLGGFWRLNSQ
jgi:hypothetical protein